MKNYSTKQCINTGNWVHMCPVLAEVTTKKIAYFKQVVMNSGSFESQRLLVSVGDDHRGRVQLDFCPFCGVNIETKQDGGQDNDYSI